MANAWSIYHGLFEFAELGKSNYRIVKLGWDVTITGPQVRKDLGITKASELKGHSLAMPKGMVSINILLDCVLIGAGLTRDDIKVVDVASLADSAQAVKEGRADGSFIAIGASALKDLDSVVPMRFLDCKAISPENEKKMFEYAPTVNYYQAKGGSTTAVIDDTVVVSQDQGLVCMDFANEDVVYAAAKALYEHYDELAVIHPQLKASFKPEMSVRKTFPVPFHPGAIKFYKEVGIWTSEMDKAQQQVLASQ